MFNCHALPFPLSSFVPNWLNMYTPKQTALIAVDMLNDFFCSDLWPNSILPASRRTLTSNINSLVATCRTLGIPIIWVKQAFKEDLSDAFPHMRASNRKYTIEHTAGCDFLPELSIEPEDTILVKSRFSAFFKTDLHAHLQAIGCKHIVLAGITTAWCIRSTATDAYQHDYKVTLASDCMQGFAQPDHDAALEAMDGYIATSICGDDLSDFISPETERPSVSELE